jgi:hypothetical protein
MGRQPIKNPLRMIQVTYLFEMIDEFIPLDLEKREIISTKEAAYHLNRRAQTLRKWACYEDGPIGPVRINGRLGWSVNEIRKLLNLENAK